MAESVSQEKKEGEEENEMMMMEWLMEKTCWPREKCKNFMRLMIEREREREREKRIE